MSAQYLLLCLMITTGELLHVIRQRNFVPAATDTNIIWQYANEEIGFKQCFYAACNCTGMRLAH
jgi:hypothetical protein